MSDIHRKCECGSGIEARWCCHKENKLINTMSIKSREKQPDTMVQRVTDFIEEVYYNFGQSKHTETAITNGLLKLQMEMSLRLGQRVMDMNGNQSPITGTHNVCVRTAVLIRGDNISYTTNSFIGGTTEMETATMAANTAIQSLCRQVGRLTRGDFTVFYIILGTFNYDNGIFTLNPAADAKDVCQVSVELTHNGNSFKLAAMSAKCLFNWQ